MDALREPELLKLKVRTPHITGLYSKSATTSLSNICYNCIGCNCQHTGQPIHIEQPYDGSGNVVDPPPGNYIHRAEDFEEHYPTHYIARPSETIHQSNIVHKYRNKALIVRYKNRLINAQSFMPYFRIRGSNMSLGTKPVKDSMMLLSIRARMESARTYSETRR